MDPIRLGISSGGRADCCQLLPAMVSRHGLICGATGTGKTVTMRLLLEQLHRRGIPIFATDFKGDLSGLGAAGGDNAKVQERLSRFGLGQNYFHAFPLELWGPSALPLRTTISELGPELLALMLALNDNQSGLMQLLFRIADEQGLLLLDWKDLQALIRFAETERRSLEQHYGNISPASLGAIKRKFLAVERDGADALFGEPALDLQDLLGGARIHLLDASKLHPRVYGILLLWLLAELYENLPESGDTVKISLFFDEAHLLFDELPKRLCDQVEQIVKLIRSRGVGIFFVTQNPLDIPEAILAQLGNRIQHALRAYTPKEQRAVKAAASSFRANPAFDTAAVIGELAVGEALVSCLDQDGVPQPVQRLLIQPPASRLSPLDAQEIAQLLRDSPLSGKYGAQLDRESAYEQLQRRQTEQAQSAGGETIGKEGAERAARGGRHKDRGELGRALNSMANSFGRQLGRELVRGLLGALTGRR
ncbi:helicase HerA-like domain-containing protein [Microbulbifer magnicolonia]|uniref:helicase HerA-like domain-containing protein n=1 Tax=Microbulbifer magnicolonia TaxID=3109744 RepID=UPI002B40550F|nr:helicase HerA-like domain-containing protein [Microbulbifer sp. GG15]